jgi:hypothetical protein
MASQVPSLKKKFLDYGVYADATINELIPKEKLKNTPVLSAHLLQTVYLENQNGKFVQRQLPMEAQYAPVHSILTSDVNHDGSLDLILAGNNKYNRIYLGNCNANHGIVLLGNGAGLFKYVTQAESGLKIRGDVRGIVQIENEVFFGVNDSKLMSYKISEQP